VWLAGIAQALNGNLAITPTTPKKKEKSKQIRVIPNWQEQAASSVQKAAPRSQVVWEEGQIV